MKATLTFKTREQAEIFATKWARYTKEGHVIGAGTENVQVIVYDVDDDRKKFIDNYILNLNNELDHTNRIQT